MNTTCFITGKNNIKADALIEGINMKLEWTKNDTELVH